MSILVKRLEFNSNGHQKLISLRQKILRSPLGLKFTIEELENEATQNHFGIFENEKLIGGLILVLQDAEKVKMRQVCIDFEFQGKGFGQQLVLYSENWAKEKGFKIMFCHARENALSFYKKMNYKVTGNSFEEVGLKHFKLEKKLI